MKTMLLKIKGFYQRTTLREKFLMLSFILVALFLWTGDWLGRLSEWNDLRQSANSTLTNQAQILARGPEFSQGLNRALERVDPSKTYDGAQLPERTEILLANSGLSGQADFAAVRTREGEIFNDHNLRVSLKKISIAQLERFNALLKEDNPYINIESVRIAANPRNPEELDVRFEINSFELKDLNF